MQYVQSFIFPRLGIKAQKKTELNTPNCLGGHRKAAHGSGK